VTFSEIKKGVFLRSAAAEPYRHLLLFGIDQKHRGLEDVRQLAALVYQKLKANKAGSNGVVFDGLAIGAKSAADVAAAFTEGAVLASYEFKKYKTKQSSKKEDNGERDSELKEI